jgi:O-glycosyl hydrolase
MYVSSRWISTLVVLLCFCCFKGLGQGAPVVLRMDTRHVCQTIDNFAASDAWACQFVGTWPAAKKNAIADLLFSMDTTKEGVLKGIGLSLWRCNIGAGSAAQGDSSGIRDMWRRAWGSLGAGQLWFLQAARQRGVRQFLGFYNSPPVELTRNGRAYASVAGVCNIDSSRYAAFAEHAVKTVQRVKRTTGIQLDYISPVNEPQWDWSDGGQEGCPYNNEEIYGVIKAMDRAFGRSGISAKVLMPEAGQLKYLLTDEDKRGKGGQVDAFFAKSSPTYVGKFGSVGKMVAGHSYFSTSPFGAGVELRKKLAQAVSGKEVRYWQSEYCILGDNGGEINGSKRDTGMDAALYVAKVIHMDLVYGQASAWQWWLAVSPYNYKDGLIYVDKGMKDGSFHDSKKLWALGNFCRFVRPGMQRVEVTGAEDGLYVSGYIGGQGSQRVVVVINTLPVDKTVEVAGAGVIAVFTTSDQESLGRRMVAAGEALVVPARSICTLVMRFNFTIYKYTDLLYGVMPAAFFGTRAQHSFALSDTAFSLEDNCSSCRRDTESMGSHLFCTPMLVISTSGGMRLATA